MQSSQWPTMTTHSTESQGGWSYGRPIAENHHELVVRLVPPTRRKHCPALGIHSDSCFRDWCGGGAIGWMTVDTEKGTHSGTEFGEQDTVAAATHLTV